MSLFELFSQRYSRDGGGSHGSCRSHGFRLFLLCFVSCGIGPFGEQLAGADRAYPDPQGGWLYVLDGSQAAANPAAALDGSWNHNNNSDSWSGDGRGAGNGLPGGVESVGGILTFEDAVATGSSDSDNRRFYFMRPLPVSVTNADNFLDDGVTFSFRARLTPGVAVDPKTELADAPNGLINLDAGKGMIGFRQAGGGGGIVSLSLHKAVEDTGLSTTLNMVQPGLHVNSLFGNSSSPFVNPDGPGTRNILPLDSSQFHEFWITIQANGADPGTHRVSIYVDGSLVPTVFNVTAGTGSESGWSNYVALGLGGTAQRGAFDLDYFAFKLGARAPSGLNAPVVFVREPEDAFGVVGSVASFVAEVTGTPQIAFRWYRGSQIIAGATNATYTTPVLVAQDHGSTFYVVASNHLGSVTSRVATLSLVSPPLISQHPQNVHATNGGVATFSVTAESPAAMSYQWRMNGQILSGQVMASLIFNPAIPSHAGAYDVIVSHFAGAVTSQVATLTVDSFDYGDAPEVGFSFPTTFANNGARHKLLGGLRLGGTVDADLDGAPHSVALGDDASGVDDEDGIRFVTGAVAGIPVTVEVVVSAPGLLSGWIDFGGDRSWAQATDRVFTNVALVSGTNLLQLNVPPTAVAGTSYARFRFSSQSLASFAGPAVDGEVEDYVLMIAQRADLRVGLTTNLDPVAIGSNLVYTIAVTNHGPSVAEAILVENVLPEGVGFVTAQTSSGSGCAWEGRFVRCQWPTLGSALGFTVNLVVSVPTAGSITNQVTVSAAQTDTNTQNNSAMLVVLAEAPPVFTLQPTSGGAALGGTVHFTAIVSGAAPLHYQWRQNNVPIPGATASSLSVSNISASSEGVYTLLASNRVGVAVSAAADLTVLHPPLIVNHPTNATRFAGGSVSFAITAQGSAPFTYQWYNGSSAIDRGTNATLNLTNLIRSNTGFYHVEVRNGAGLAVSQPAHLLVDEADFGDAPDPTFPTLAVNSGAYHLVRPGIFLGAGVSYEPDGSPHATAAGDTDDGIAWPTTLLAGTSAQLTVSASTNGLVDAWIDFDRDGNWSGAAEHVLANAVVVSGSNVRAISVPVNASTGQTFARVRFRTSGALGVTGPAADGEVEDYAVTLQGSADLAAGVSLPAYVALGGSYSGTAQVTNRGPSAAAAWLEYSLPAGTLVVSALPSQGSCSNANGVLRCEFGTVASSSGAHVSLVFTTSVQGASLHNVLVGSPMMDGNLSNNMVQGTTVALNPPVITVQPVGKTITNSGNVSFQVAATGDQLQYQWRFEGQPLSQATNATLQISASLAHAGNYSVVVSNRAAAVASETVTLTVLAPPAVLTQPLSQAVVMGSNLTIFVVATGSGPLRYNWRFNSMDLPGGTNASVNIPQVTPAHAGTYQVWIANDLGAISSQPATVQVLVPPTFVGTPTGASVLAGRNALLGIAVTGTEPFTYRWSVGGNVIPGATGPELLLPGVQTNAAGIYSVLVSNAGGSIAAELALQVLQADFGDAPDPHYPTSEARGGAYHILRPRIWLGSSADHEPDGLTSATANGDDLQNSDDEDGVLFFTPLRQGQMGEIAVIASTNSFLDAWIDFDVTGLWSEAGEQVFRNTPLLPGTNWLRFPVSPTASVGSTFARFRMSTTGNLPVTGRAEDGEVEDYRISIEPAFDLEVTHAAMPAEVEIGASLSYAIRVTNQTALAASGVRLTNVVPRHTALVGVISTQGSCSHTNGIVICNLGSLPGNGSALISLELVAQQGGILTNIAVVAANEFDPATTNSRSEAVMRVVGSAGPFRRNDPIDLTATGAASLYPSTIFVSGVASIVERVTVTISNLSHTFPDDLDILLVGPNGTNVMLMSDAGGGNTMSDVTLTFADAASLALPNAGAISSGSVRPGNFDTSTDALPAPAPAGPYGRTLSVFQGINPNGAWKLYVQDDEDDDFGVINDGWTLHFVTLGPMADIMVSGVASASTLAVGTNLTYTFSVKNLGPVAASGAHFYNVSPSALEGIQIVSSQGGCTNTGGLIDCNLGNLDIGATATIVVTGRLGALGLATNAFFVTADQPDPVPANNRGELVTSVERPADLALTMNPLPGTVLLGQQVQYNFQVVNLGGSGVTEVILENALAPQAVVIAVTSSQGACITSNGVIRCDLGSIPAGGSAQVSVGVEASRIGTLTNSATVHGREFDVTEANNRVVAQTVVTSLVPPYVSGLPISIPSVGGAMPYPSVLRVSGETGTIHAVSVTLSNINHGALADLDILLVGPNGQQVMLCSDVGGNTPGATLTFTDDASGALGGGGVMTGVYRPTNLEGANDSFPAPAPSGPFSGNLASFRGTNPNGDWSLYVVDDNAGNAGNIGGGWSLTLSLAEPMADVSVAVTASPGVVAVGSNLVYSIVLRNEGPAYAYGVTFSNRVPAGTQLLSISGSPGSSRFEGGVLYGQSGNMAPGASVSWTVLVSPTLGIALTNQVQVGSQSADLNLSNNLSTVVTPIGIAPVVVMRPSNQIGISGRGVTFSVAAVGDAPLRYQWFIHGTNIMGATNADLILSAVTRSDAGVYSVRIANFAGSTLSGAAVLTVLEPPTISGLSSLNFDEDSTSGAINFTVGDFETAPDNLLLAVSSSDEGLFGASGIVLSGEGALRTLRLTPLPDRNGSAFISVRVTDLDNLSSTNQFLVTVRPLNDLPTVSPIGAQQVAQNGTKLVSFVVGDVETAPADITVQVTSSDPALFPPASLTPSVSGSNRVVTLAPVQQGTGVASIFVHVIDAQGGRITNTFTVTVAANTPPIISPIGPAQTLEDVAVPGIPFVIGDQETPAGALTIVAQSSNPVLFPASQMSISGTGSNRVANLVPAPQRSGSAVITITVEDISGAKASRSFDVQVLSQNDAPIASTLPNQAMLEGSTLSLPVSVRDEESDAALLVMGARSDNQALLPNILTTGTGPNRTLSFSPTPEMVGTTIIRYWVQDPQLLATTNVMALTVVRSTNAPVITTQPRGLVVSNGVNATLMAVVAGSAPMSYQWRRDGISVPGATSASLNFTSIQPADAGAYTLAVTNSAGATVSAPAVIQVVNGESSSTNSAPAVSPFPDVTLLEDTTTNLLMTISDIDTPAIRLSVTASSSNPALIPDVNLRFDGHGNVRTLNVEPVRDAFGSAVVTVTVSDGIHSAVDVFLVTVIPVNDPPTLNELPDVALTAGAGDFDVALSGIGRGAANETSGNLIVISSSSAVGIVTIRARTYSSPSTTGIQKIRPTTVPGMATITLGVNDSMPTNNLTTRSFTAFVHSASNNLPSISSFATLTVDEDQVVAPMMFTVGDAETPATALGVRAHSSNRALLPDGSMTISGTGPARSLTLTPAPDQSGTAIVTLQVIDDGFGMVSTSFALTVNAVNDLPNISEIGDQVVTVNGSSGILPFTISDAEIHASQLAVTASSTNPTLVPAGNIFLGGSGTNRAVRVTPAAGQAGSARIDLMVSDGTTNRIESFLVQVSGANAAPQVSDLPNQHIPEDSAPVTVPFTIGDDLTPAGSLQVQVSSSDSALIPMGNITLGGTGANRTVTLRPAADQFGSAVITIQVADAAGLVAWDHFIVTVSPVNDWPSLNAVGNVVLDPATGTMLVALTGLSAGPANELQLLAISAVSSVPGLVANPTVEYLAGASSAVLRLNAAAATNGVATVTVAVHDGQAQNAITTRQFTVTVAAGPGAEQVEIVELTLGPAVTVRFTTVPGKTHTLEYNASGAANSWMPLGSIVGNGGVGALSDGSPTGPMRWYRIRVD